jgi:hypothetical protein
MAVVPNAALFVTSLFHSSVPSTVSCTQHPRSGAQTIFATRQSICPTRLVAAPRNNGCADAIMQTHHTRIETLIRRIVVTDRGTSPLPLVREDVWDAG